MAWTIHYYTSPKGDSPIEQFLASLPEKARNKCLSYIELLREREARLPRNYTGHVRGYLWELRPEWGGVEFRLFYFLGTEQRIFIVHAIIKKSQKLKATDITLAENRIAEIRQREQEKEG